MRPDLLTRPDPDGPAFEVGLWHTRFPDRLRAVMEQIPLGEVRAVVRPVRPGRTLQYDAFVISPEFRGMSEAERGQFTHTQMLDHLWDEQHRVGGLFAYTPEEWAALNAPAGGGDAAGGGDGAKTNGD